MNIAVFIKRTTFHEGYGGLETQNQTLCEGLAKRGNKITVFSPKHEQNKSFLSKNGVDYIFVDCSFRSLAGLDFLDKNNWVHKSFEAFKIAHDEDAFDIILAQSSSGLGLIRRKDEITIPLISISHGTTVGEYRTLLQSIKSVKDVLRLIPTTGYLLGINFFIRQRRFVLKSNKVIAVSSVVKQALMDETFVNEKNVVVIHNGVDESKIPVKKDYPIKDTLTILFASKVIKSKGIGDLIEALDDERLINVELEALGSGEDIDFYTEVVRKKDLSDRVFIRGGLPYEEYLAKIKEADVLAIPSRRVEGFPMSAPEAMFAGLPVIGSDLGGTEEGIEHGITGYVYKSGDVEELRKAILNFLEQPSRIETMGKAGQVKAQHEFSLDAMLNRYEQVMKASIR